MAKLSDVLVQWAYDEHAKHMVGADSRDLRVITARYLALRALQRECGHDGMKQVRSDLWQCQACGGLQTAKDPRTLRMPGTFDDDSRGGAIGVELADWTPPAGVVFHR